MVASGQGMSELHPPASLSNSHRLRKPETRGNDAGHLPSGTVGIPSNEDSLGRDGSVILKHHRPRGHLIPILEKHLLHRGIGFPEINTFIQRAKVKGFLDS